MRRTEAILLLTKEIHEFRARKATLEVELRRISEALRDRMARLSDLVPDADGLVSEDDVAPAAATVAMPRRFSELVIEVMRSKPEAEWHVNDVSRSLPGRNPPTVRSTMARMAESGVLIRTFHGRYRLATASDRASSDETPSMFDDESTGKEVTKTED